MKGIIITHIIFVETPNTETTLETQTYMEWRLKQIVTRCRVNRREYNIKTNFKREDNSKSDKKIIDSVDWFEEDHFKLNLRGGGSY